MVDELSAPVRVVRDHWGVPHIYASTVGDLFFAQGFVQASDRLFQMDLWRRASQGRLAEVLGANFIARDAMTRRVQYRGDLDREWASYGPDAHAIAAAFVKGINAWVRMADERPPEEFMLAGWLPERWYPEDLLNRTDAFLASDGARLEVLRARLTTAVGAAKADALLGERRTAAASDLDPALVTFAVGDALRRIGTAPFFTTLAGRTLETPARGRGSNAWAVAPARTSTGGALLATDPHRALTNPSLRYLVHLSAPGWNVIGATAPWLPGVAIGHNEQVAWSMTAADVDDADLYVEKLNPENRHQVQGQGEWKNTTVFTDSLWVKGRREGVIAEREFTPHGVVVAVDSERHLAFTLRWAGAEQGMAAELGALALDRAESASAFRSALTHWRLPAVDFVYADREGAIGSQQVALAPSRRGWKGESVVPGWTDRFEWNGWQTTPAERPATATTNVVISANGSRPRLARLGALLGGSRKFSLDDIRTMQQDVSSWNAARLLPMLARLRSTREDVETARRALVGWDGRMAKDSANATLYGLFERAALRRLIQHRVPGPLVDEMIDRAGNLLVEQLTGPTPVWFDGNVARARDALVLDALAAAVDEATRLGGPRGMVPAWGSLHTALFAHPLAIGDAARQRFNAGPFAVGGHGDTVMATNGRGLEASVGPSFRAVFDLADWDRSIAQNAPGQSGSPASSYFSDLSKLWAEDKYFPLLFTDGAIQQNTDRLLILAPSRK